MIAARQRAVSTRSDSQCTDLKSRLIYCALAHSKASVSHPVRFAMSATKTATYQYKLINCQNPRDAIRRPLQIAADAHANAVSSAWLVTYATYGINKNIIAQCTVLHTSINAVSRVADR